VIIGTIAFLEDDTVGLSASAEPEADEADEVGSEAYSDDEPVCACTCTCLLLLLLSVCVCVCVCV
jgi:hypothetical protein